MEASKPWMNNHFVAHFDMLGMSSLIRRNSELAWKKLLDLSRVSQERLSLAIERMDSGGYIQDQVHDFTFSDTIVAFSKSDTDNDALAIVLLTTELFVSSLHYCIPLRGGIAYGPFAFNFDLNLFSGPALLDAYELGESSQWLGISLNRKVAEAIMRLPAAISPRGRSTIVEWGVPCKGGSTENRFVVNWPESHHNNYAGPIPLPVETFYQPFSDLWGPFELLEDSKRVKYESTVAFINAGFK